MQSVISLEQVGTQTINNVRVPVYALPTGRYVKQGTSLISVEGAKALKNGAYPLHHNIVSPTTNDEVPLALRSQDDQTASAQQTLRALMDRLIEVKAPFASISEN